MLTSIKGEINSKTIIVGDFNTTLTPMDRPTNQKINKETQTLNDTIDQFSSIQFSGSVVFYSLLPYGLQHSRPSCPSPTPKVYPNSCPLSCWCHPTISSFIVPFSSHLQSFPETGSFSMSQFFISGGQIIGVSASIFPMNIQDWFPLGCTGWISMLSKGLSRVFSKARVGCSDRTALKQVYYQGWNRSSNSTGWMHETRAQGWCTGKTWRDEMGREVGEGIRMRDTCKFMADSCQCMAKTTTIL